MENKNSDKRVVPKWTDAHLYPTNFQKMSVRLAVQVITILVDADQASDLIYNFSIEGLI